MALTLNDVDLTDPRRFVDGVPHEMLSLLRREDPVHWHDEPDGAGFWAVTSHADVVTVNRDAQTFSSELGGTYMHDLEPDQLEQQRLMMLNMDAPRHTKLRKLVSRGFTPRMIGILTEHVRDLARSIVDDVASRGECDFVVDVAAELPLQVIAEMMGVPGADRHKVFDWTNRMIGAADPEFATSPEDAQEAAAELYAYANALAERKRREPGDDIVTALLTAEVEGDRLSELEFDLFFLLLAVAGNETTRNATSHGMLALIEHPDQRARLVEQPELIPTAVEEMLRWATPVMYFRRTATRDVELGGKAVKAGDKVLMWHMSANRDEAVFDDPFRFDVGRDPNDHVAFGGGGPHFCLGANLARVEMRTVFHELLHRVPDMELTGPVQRLRSNFINGIKHMPVRFTPEG